ncbi:hypothetical protein LUR56_40750 [Streptomyces sp. MT29]|nr:hypothetical protein [Streptomyces sp. MT29]
MPATPGSIRHIRRIVDAELRLRDCPPDQISQAQQIVAELVAPFCLDADVLHYGLTIQASPDTPGGHTVSVGAQGTHVRRDLPIPKPRPPLDDHPRP